jgi:negative regulator of replication initiation
MFRQTMPIKREREESEYNNSEKDDQELVSRIAETLDRHSGKSASDILPRPIRYILTTHLKRLVPSEKKRDRLNATIGSFGVDSTKNSHK